MSTNLLAAINSVALGIGRFPSLDAMLDYALRKVLEVLPTEAGGLYLLDEERGELSLAVHHGLSERAWRDFDHLRLGEGLSGRVAMTGEPIVIRALKDDPRLTRMAARIEGIRAFASVPLRSNFKTYGTLNVYSQADLAFSEEEVQLLTSMASQIGLAVANTRLYLELKASERRFRGLVENAEDVIYLTDLDGRIVYANPAFGRLLGYDLDAVYADGRGLLSIVHPAERDEMAARLPELMAGAIIGPVMRAMELRLLHADGTRVLWFSQTAVPLRDENGRPTGLQCIAQDITARREWQEQATRAARLADLGRMAAAIAHEIRNPLGAIVNSINVLKRSATAAATAAAATATVTAAATVDSSATFGAAARDRRATDEDAHLLDIVAEEAARLNGIVSEVLIFARPPLRAAVPCDVPELLDSTVAFFERSGKLRDGMTVRVSTNARAAAPAASTADASEASADGRVASAAPGGSGDAVAAELPPVLADPNQMRQVLWNLLANATESGVVARAPVSAGPGASSSSSASAYPGVIDVTAAPAGDGRSVIIAVTDDGPGVADTTAVLEPFYTTRAQGTGLGLAIVAHIVRDHGGTVTVENVPGRGARFSVALPIARPDS